MLNSSSSLLLIIFLQFHIINSKPVSSDIEKYNATTFLLKYGYIPSNTNINDIVLTNAIFTFQRYFNIPQTGVIDIPTKEMMQKPRCGIKDSISTTRQYELGPSYWEKTDLTYKIMNVTPDLSQKQVHDAIQDAFYMWSAVVNLTFRPVNEQIDIKIKFTQKYHDDTYPFDGPGGALAHAFFPGEDNGGDIHFDEDETWTANTNVGSNLMQIATHELGHSLGLRHSNVKNSVMYPEYYYRQNFALHADDIAGIQKLYGKKEYIEPITPDRCTAKITAVAVIRKELFIFSGEWYWRINTTNHLFSEKAYPVYEFWIGFPKSFSVDAVFENSNGITSFFSGTLFWRFDANKLISSVNGLSITELGLPSNLIIDDAYEYNYYTYYIKGAVYWKFDYNGNLITHSRMTMLWHDMPIDAAFVYHRTTYLFSGNYYYRINSHKMYWYPEFPRSIRCVWLKCANNIVSRASTIYVYKVLLLISFVIYLFYKN